MDKLKVKYIQKSIERESFKQMMKEVTLRKEIVNELKTTYNQYISNLDSKSLLDSSLHELKEI